MKHKNLAVWQLILLVLGLFLIFGPFVWDFLTEIFSSLKDISLEDVFTRDGMLVAGFIMLGIVGIYEIIKDFGDKPKSKLIK